MVLDRTEKSVDERVFSFKEERDRDGNIELAAVIGKLIMKQEDSKRIEKKCQKTIAAQGLMAKRLTTSVRRF